MLGFLPEFEFVGPFSTFAILVKAIAESIDEEVFDILPPLRPDTGKYGLPATTRSEGDEVRVAVSRVVQQFEVIASLEQELNRLRHPV